MKIQTTYIPTDIAGQPFNFDNFYGLADLQKLGADLGRAGVTDDDALQFHVGADGALSITTTRTV